jgi:hypothetical protein
MPPRGAMYPHLMRVVDVLEVIVDSEAGVYLQGSTVLARGERVPPTTMMAAASAPF